MIQSNATSIANVSSVTRASSLMHHPRTEIRTTSAPEIHPRGDASTAQVDIDSVPPAWHANITMLPPPPEWTAGLYPPIPNFTIPSSGSYTDPNAEAARDFGLAVGLGVGIPLFLVVAGVVALRCLRGPSEARTAQEARPAAAASPGSTDNKGLARGNTAAARGPVEEIEMDSFGHDIEAQPVAQALALQGHDDDDKRLLTA